jgi:hypothetical protein
MMREPKGTDPAFQPAIAHFLRRGICNSLLFAHLTPIARNIGKATVIRNCRTQVSGICCTCAAIKGRVECGEKLL